MAKVYTAQEMRKEADILENDYFDWHEEVEMLRQAVDAIERKEKGE